MTDKHREPPDVRRPMTDYVAEAKPDSPAPSCHVCGAQMVVKEFKCLSCGTTTGVQPAAIREVKMSDAEFADHVAKKEAAMREPTDKHRRRKENKPWSCGHPDCPCSGGRLHAATGRPLDVMPTIDKHREAAREILLPIASAEFEKGYRKTESVGEDVIEAAVSILARHFPAAEPREIPTNQRTLYKQVDCPKCKHRFAAEIGHFPAADPEAKL